MPRLAVLGQPVAHSRSPAMHSAALAALGLAPEWTYEAIDVSADGFADLIAALPGRGFAGVNVTVPHKLAALAAADEASASAREIGAANTLTFEDGRVLAENTDTVGIIDALPSPPAGKRALVMGAGGSARAAIWALRNAGAEVRVWNRTAEKAAALADAFAVQTFAKDEGRGTRDFDLLLNATTVGLEAANPVTPSGGQPLGGRGVDDLKPLPIEADGLHARQVVIDLVYGSEQTPLIAAAQAAATTPVDGIEVLVHQGAASLRLWTGDDAPIEVMRAAAIEAGR
jgi:shikimate dehydrogenase